jgi:multidrug resistance efflux pump
MTVQTEPAPTARAEGDPLGRGVSTADPTSRVARVPEVVDADTTPHVSDVINGDNPNVEVVASPKRRRFSVRRILLAGGGLALVVGAFVGFSIYRDGQLYISTDNAQLTGTPVQVGAMNAGRVDSVTPSVGSTVHKGDTLAQVDLPSQVGTAQNGQPKLGFLDAGNSSVTVQSPIDGVVLAVPTTPGASVQAGQALVTLVDPTQLWVNANIDETSIDRVKVGQAVTVHVDALNEDMPGRVESITPATASTFSLLPTQATSGNFTKVTQQVPVRISINLGNQPTLLGSSVEVKIRAAA